MKIKVRKLKGFVFPTLFAMLFTGFIATSLIVKNQLSEPAFNDDTDFNYTTKSIFTSEVPTVNEDITIIRPYTADTVKINKQFYDYMGEAENQKNSIIYYEDTYMQNSGVTYINEGQFDINAILDGVVTETGDDKTLGKYVKIKHSNDMISTYQSLSEVTVKKDDEIKQGQVIGKCGKNNIDTTNENQLQFELSYKGQYVNPEEYFDKKVQDL